MPLPVKYADVSVSLKQFQDISSGRHNAGEVRLKDAHTIDKVNHYVSRTGRNKVSLSHAEVIAVKQAFVDALARGGVQADEIAKVRAQLGLAPEKAVDTQLMERSLRPLSRQQIREILDRNAEALNAGQNEVTIRTSAQIYARVGDDTRRRRIAERDAANAGLAESRTVETQRGFSLFQSLLAGDVDFRSKADRAELLDMAKKALDIVLDHSNGHPRADRQAKISWGSNGERRFTMEAGTDEATFARRLEDMIVRLSGLGPGADAIELRAAFRAVPRGDRSRWIDALVRDGGDKTPYKVRTLCVALLQDAGVDDYESLSFPNRLPDAAATSLLRELAALPEGASAERVVSAFVNTNERLFGQYRTLAADILADVRAVFGAAVVPADTTIRLFVTPEAVEGLARAQGGNRLAPEAMRDALRASAAEAAANRALAARVEARLAELNLPRQTPAATAVNALKSRNPDLVGRLAACRTPEAVAEALDSVLDRMDAELRRASSVQTCRAQFTASSPPALCTSSAGGICPPTPRSRSSRRSATWRSASPTSAPPSSRSATSSRSRTPRRGSSGNGSSRRTRWATSTWTPFSTRPRRSTSPRSPRRSARAGPSRTSIGR